VVRTLMVDGHNVIGARPDGWWRDRPGAARRLLARVQCLAAAPSGGDGGPTAVVLVLDDPVSGLPEGDHGGVTVRYARRRGRDAADDRIVEDVAALDGPVEVVTSDRVLAARVARPGVAVIGAGTFLAQLDRAGC
jgi:predicted RNA-binding protein with PIN domain